MCSSSLNALSPVYFPNEDNIVKSLFLPVAKVSSSFDCLSGYFSSSVLTELAEPLAYLFENPQTTGRFIVSPNLSEKDKNALLSAYDEGDSIIDYLFDKKENIEEALLSTTLDVMKYLIKTKRLDLRVALMKKGMMHAKIWVFNTPHGNVAIHGSGNATKSGLMTNFEQLIFSKEWESNSSKIIIDSYKSRFSDFWDGRRDDSYTLRLNNSTVASIFALSKGNANEQSLNSLIKQLKSVMELNSQIPKLTIPHWLNYREGDYSHQGEAIDAWLQNGNMGILSIATGGGKTLTSLTAAAIALADEDKALVVVAVPTKPLIQQWSKDVENFAISPFETAGLSTLAITRKLKSIKRELKFLAGHQIVIITHDALKNPQVKNEIEKFSCKKVLIADEAHNLGSAGFLNDLPYFFDQRLALSATIDRQYDLVGSELLKSFFGDVVFEYTVEEAIGVCLVPFKYFVHKVYLNGAETEKWIELSQKIRRLYGFGDSDSEAKADLLAIRRRAIAENAVEKIALFQQLFRTQPDKKYTLVFCTDKDKEQLIAVNSVLREENVRFRQITAEETKNKELTNKIITDFYKQEVQVLTSKRVLDEGFNIPPIETAYIVSSNGVERQWLQRLGRVLRQCNDTGKKEAVIHDFVVIPPDVEQDSSLRTLINNELKRVTRFSELSNNGSETSGSLELIRDLTNLLE